MDARITVTICGLTAALLLAATGALAAGQGQDSTNKGAAKGSFRAAQEKGLDLSVDYDALAAKPEKSKASEEGKTGEGEAQESPAAAGSYRAAQDQNVPQGVDWSRRLGKNWRMDPVALNRRQDGRHSDHNADVEDQVIGVEIRRPF